MTLVMVGGVSKAMVGARVLDRQDGQDRSQTVQYRWRPRRHRRTLSCLHFEHCLRTSA
jgi:hypothetical protein